MSHTVAGALLGAGTGGVLYGGDLGALLLRAEVRGAAGPWVTERVGRSRG